MNETPDIESLYIRTKKILKAQERSAKIALWLTYAALGLISLMLGLFIGFEKVIFK